MRPLPEAIYGLLADWPRHRDEPWLAPLLEREDQVRAQRSLQRRIQRCRTGAFKPMPGSTTGPRRSTASRFEDLFALDKVAPCLLASLR
jgi:hypothetical protein